MNLKISVKKTHKLLFTVKYEGGGDICKNLNINFPFRFIFKHEILKPVPNKVAYVNDGKGLCFQLVFV